MPGALKGRSSLFWTCSFLNCEEFGGQKTVCLFGWRISSAIWRLFLPGWRLFLPTLRLSGSAETFFSFGDYVPLFGDYPCLVGDYSSQLGDYRLFASFIEVLSSPYTPLLFPHTRVWSCGSTFTFCNSSSAITLLMSLSYFFSKWLTSFV